MGTNKLEIIHAYSYSATEGFNLLFNDKIDLSTEELSRHDNAFGRTGLGIILFLQAALGMEDGMMERAQNELFAAEKAAESAKKDSNKLKGKSSRFGSTVPYVRRLGFYVSSLLTTLRNYS